MKDDLPGIVFHILSSELKGGATKTVKLNLRGTVEDLLVWDIVKKKFENGFKVYAAGDFSAQLNDVLNEENKRLERRLAVLESELREARARLAASQTKG